MQTHLTLFISIWTLSAALQCPPQSVFPEVGCINDARADDVSTQKDLNRFCFRDTGAEFFTLFFTFDDYTVSNDYTGCALFDESADGLIDKAICVTVSPTSTKSFVPVYKTLTYYSCTNAYSDRCSNPVVLRNQVTDVCCSVSVQSVDPFPSHAGANAKDTVVQCNLVSTLRGTLVNVCSFPSGPGSSTGDCVLFTGTCTSDADCPSLPCKTTRCDVPPGSTTSSKVCIQTSQENGASCGGSGLCGSMSCVSGGCVESFLPNGSVCRPQAGGKACDLEEKCTGSNFACPDDARQPVGTVCGAAATDCSGADTCSADGVCQLNDKPAGATCGGGTVGVTSCSDADTCDGNGVCANVNHHPDGSSCPGGTSDFCAQRQCFSGVCQWAHAGQSYATEAAARTAANDHCNQGRNCYTYTCVGDHMTGDQPSPCVPGGLKAGNPCEPITGSACEKLCCDEETNRCTKKDLCGGFPVQSPNRRILEILAASSPNSKATALPN